MNKVEIKARVEFRMKPLLHKGVRILYKNAEFSITDYDWFDSSNSYIINVSDRKDPLEFNLTTIQAFLDNIKRKDGQPIPKFNEDGTALPSRHPNKRRAAVTAGDDEEEEEIPEEPNMDTEEEEAPKIVQQPTPPRKNGKFVHIESTTKVYVTRDYGIFSILQGNRSLNKSKIKRIVEEIGAGTNLLKLCPIIVSEEGNKLKVIDGQHRLEVAKQIKSNVWYVICDPLTLYQIAKVNSNTEKWTGKDFINCYAQTGNPSYVKLKEFATVYGFPLSVNLALLQNGTMKNDTGGSKSAQKAFETGAFKVRKEDEAIAIAQQVERFKDFHGYRSRNFVVAICKILDAQKISIDEVVNAFEKNKDQLFIQGNWKNYLVNLETIVNIGKGKRRVIY